MTCRSLIAAVGFAVLLLSSMLARAEDWPQFRGPRHDGISRETGFRKRLVTPPPKLWEREIGSGFSAFACIGDHVYTCGTKDDQQVVYCLGADDGRVVWQTPIEPAYRERQGGDGPRATPTVADGRVYVQGALGRVLCLDAQSGKEVWSRRFEAKPTWGYSASVLVDDGLAFVTGDNALAALDASSGDLKWTAGEGTVGYATPYPFTLRGTRYIVAFMGKEAFIVESKTGKSVWSMPWVTDWDVNAAAPIVHDDLLFLSSGYNHGAIVVRLRPDGEKLSGETVWQNSTIRAKFESAVLHDGHLYAGEQSDLVCVEFTTGKERWRTPRHNDSSVLIADGHLIVQKHTGELQIGKASPEGFSPFTDVRVLGQSAKCWTIPTLYRGRLYVRDLKMAVCYDLRGSGSAQPAEPLESE